MALTFLVVPEPTDLAAPIKEPAWGLLLVGAYAIDTLVDICDRRPPRPNPDACNKALKFLKDYERIMKKFGNSLDKKRDAELDKLRDSGEISWKDLPGRMKREFPPEFIDKTLDEIKKLCNK